MDQSTIGKRVFVWGEVNGHFDSDADNFGETYEDFGTGQVNSKWVKLVGQVFGKGLRLKNTCLKKLINSIQ